MKTINTFSNEKEYKNARTMLNAYNDATMKYCKENKTNGIPCEITKAFPYADKVDNNLRSKIEVWEFMHEKPQSYLVYVSTDKKEATTWTGDFLGDVHFGNEYRSNMGDKRQPIDVFGVNGIKYHGTFFKSSGDYARLKAYKHQTKLQH